ncbi:MAG: hypothetical protein ABL984_15280 [Pyrinomonadaceae bacterium]
MSSTLTRLKALREIQGTTGPNYCLGSSKFFIGKLIGLFDQSKKWNDFMRSPWAIKNRGRVNLDAAWGLFRGAKDFNSKVLPAAIGDASANVKGPGTHLGTNVEFHHFTGSPSLADTLLLGRVPLVIGVDLPGGYSRDHFISILRDGAYNIWAVDSWEANDIYAVAQLPSDFSFTKPVKVTLNASGADDYTTIPCPTPWIGYYRDKTSKAALGIRNVI